MRVLLFSIIIVLAIISYYFGYKKKQMDHTHYKEATGIILSSNMYQEIIETNLKSMNSGIPQKSIHKRWKLTTSYSYTIEGKTFIGVDSILSGNGIISKITGKPTKEDLFNYMNITTAYAKAVVYYNPSNLEYSTLKIQ